MDKVGLRYVKGMTGTQWSWEVEGEGSSGQGSNARKSKGLECSCHGQKEAVPCYGHQLRVWTLSYGKKEQLKVLLFIISAGGTLPTLIHSFLR